MMRRFLIYSVFLCLLFGSATALTKKNEEKGPPKTEAELVGKLLNCMMYEDTVTYNTLFLDFDTVWKQVIKLRPTDPNAALDLNKLRQHPDKVQQFDPYFNSRINKTFAYVIKKGTDSGLHWKDIIQLRFELVKIGMTKDMVGYDQIAPMRFRGYIFVEDKLTRRHYGIKVNEMQNIQGFWYGGQVMNIYEASTLDEFLAKEQAETKLREKLRKYGLTPEMLAKMDTTNKDDLAKNDDDEQDEKKHIRKEVEERKYYVGKFDNEIPVKLYVRYMKGIKPGTSTEWEAIYKFGDQETYIKLDVTKKPDGTWEFNEDPAIGGMDLVLKDSTYTGTWMGGDNETGYDVKMVQKDIPPAKLKQLDDIIENKKWAKGPNDPAKKDDVDDVRGKDEGY